MTEDEQEALSFRHSMPRIMRLSSGNIALFVDGEPLRIIYVSGQPSDGIDLIEALPTSTFIETYESTLRRSRPLGLLQTLNLADIGL